MESDPMGVQPAVWHYLIMSAMQLLGMQVVLVTPTLPRLS